MTLSEFRKKSLDEQLALVFKKGKLINGVPDKKYFYKLFSLGEFYVELKYDSTEEKLLSFKSMRKPKDLEKYIERFADFYIQAQKETKKISKNPDFLF